MKKLALLLSLVLSILVFSACGGGTSGSTQADEAGGGGADSGYAATWKFAHNESERGAMHMYAVKFKELVEEQTGGAVTVDIYPDGTLGAGDSIIELLQGGGLEFALADSGYIGSFVPESQIFRVHFLLSDDTSVNRQLFKGDAMEELNQLFGQNDMLVLHHFSHGFVSWTGNKPFRTLDDFSGVKMRTVPTPILISTYQSYGANPTTINYSELYSSLQLGVVDAQENPLATIEELKLNEVQSTLTLSEHYAFVDTTVANPTFYSGLPSEIKQMLDGIFTELDDFAEGTYRENDAQLLKDIEETTDMEVIRLTTEEKEAFRSFCESNREGLRDSLGEQGMEILYKLEEEKQALLGQ